ncbi:hypothetical protein [Klenkia sp. PcliD-1-E]|uniref:hypothetical protein n=1 Tax=Klenkia sp. PcliD-1-E TaxID=2954492 RepID=UPI002096CCC6|nr:hypothetical protein [Klenkia sp. PcliD-1-E]MCO7221253.1 hypothetical protein [Klenkia sp. PcliD-1-E]
MTRPPRARRHPAAVGTGVVAGALLALPALAVAPWMLLGVMAGWSGTDIGTGEPGPTDWGLLLGSLSALVLCVAVPVGVGWGLCRLVDLVLRSRSGQAGHQFPG